MIKITCPFCGARGHKEFDYIGDGARAYPDPATASEEDWHDYVYLRDNPRGPHREIWQHVAGCRRFIAVTRDTLTHEVIACEPASEPHTAEDKS